MIVLKINFFLLIVPGFLLRVVPVFVIQKIPGLALPPGPWNWVAVPFWMAGMASVTWCVADFVHQGHGAPVPLEPPKVRVVSGLYRFVRNPLYVGVLLVQLGNLARFGSLAQLVYWIFLFTGFTLFIRTNEEPHLRMTFGAVYEEYCGKVPRWLPRFAPALR